MPVWCRADWAQNRQFSVQLPLLALMIEQRSKWLPMKVAADVVGSPVEFLWSAVEQSQRHRPIYLTTREDGLLCLL
jgi:hypothetical protein